MAKRTEINSFNILGSNTKYLEKINIHTVPGYTFNARNNIINSSNKGKTSKELQKIREQMKINTNPVKLNTKTQEYDVLIEGGLQLPVGWDKPNTKSNPKTQSYELTWDNNSGKKYTVPLSQDAIDWYNNPDNVSSGALSVVNAQNAAGKRGDIRSKNKANKLYAELIGNPDIDIANKIRSDLGLKPITVKKIPKKHKVSSTGKMSTRYTTLQGVWDPYKGASRGVQGGMSEIISPSQFLTEFRRKEAVVEYGKVYGLGLESTDKKKFRTGSKTISTGMKSANTGKYMKTWNKEVQLYETTAPKNEAQEVSLLFDKFHKKRAINEIRYGKLYHSVTKPFDEELKENEEKINALKKKAIPLQKKAGSHSKYPQKAAAYNAQAKPYQDKIDKLTARNIDLREIIKNNKLLYYEYPDEQFEKAEKYQGALADDIEYRGQNQQAIIDELQLDMKTIKHRERNTDLIPVLEDTHDVLEDKKKKIVTGINKYNWNKYYSQQFTGKDSITGDSHIGAVFDEMGHGIRPSLASQDVGKLIRHTKKYEEKMKSENEETLENIKNIELDESDNLGDFYMDKTDKEALLVKSEYISKSLAKTQEEREEYEKAHKQQAWQELHSSGPAKRYNVSQSVFRPGLRSLAKNTSGRRRTRGGEVMGLGGLV